MHIMGFDMLCPTDSGENIKTYKYIINIKILHILNIDNDPFYSTLLVLLVVLGHL